MVNSSCGTLGPESCLPTLEKLGHPHIPEDLDVERVASEWLASFANNCRKGDVEGVLDLLVKSSFASNILKGEDFIDPESPNDIPLYWRDVLALTWDFRTFEGTTKVKAFLTSQLSKSSISNVHLHDGVKPQLVRMFPDLAWIQVVFKFETAIGKCSGVARILPTTSDGVIQWKAFCVFTNLNDLKGFPEKIGTFRDHQPNHGKWEKVRQEELKFDGKDPSVLIIGAGHCGLNIAARLKALGVQSLNIERNPRIGDSWRTRYDALCLHDPVWYDHLPYIPFPPTWPVYTPAKKLANWLEYYADTLELNVWTSSTVSTAKQDPISKLWAVTVTKSDGTTRIFKVRHVILAVGSKGGQRHIPSFPGMDRFRGQTLHSTQHNKGTDQIGKKVVVIGASSSAHDICADYAEHGVDVTMVQRGSIYVISAQKGISAILKASYSEDGPPTEMADFLSASLPLLFSTGIWFRVQKITAELDRELLNGLHNCGFRTNSGYKGCSLFPLVFNRGGGYYIDDGGSQYLINGKIKLKNDAHIKEFTERGLKFEDDSEVLADVIVFCTGLGDPRETVRQLFGDYVADNSNKIWGLTDEGEISGTHRNIGVQGLYNIMGNLGSTRFYSKHLALQIKAIEEGIFDPSYDSYQNKF